MEPDNSYEDARRAEAYARLQFPGTYYLAFRDLPEIIRTQVGPGGRALDFGCGAGRSSRFLRALGFQVTGVDISEEMIREALSLDPGGDYRLIPDGDFGPLGDETFDLALSAFAFDNVPTRERKVALFRGLGRLLKDGGALVNLVSTPEIYIHEWASFSTRNFPENRMAGSGDRVRIVITAIGDPRPVEDVVWNDADYREVYEESGLACVGLHKPLAREDEPFAWVNETRIAPWAIYVLKRVAAPGSGRRAPSG
jgi:SAM-dependent methyltransferase